MSTNLSDIPSSYVEQYLRPLKEYLTDDTISEVVINPDGLIFIERANLNNMEKVDIQLPASSIKQLGRQLASETKNALGKHHPIVSGRVIVWGEPLRVQVLVEPAIEEGVSLSIRKFVSHILAPSDLKFVAGKAVNVEEGRQEKHRNIQRLVDKGCLEELMCSVIEERFNILISGGTSSGKTTVARALLAMADQGERLITIEDAQELRPPQPNLVSLISDRLKGSERSPSKLLESSLRMRPDRIVLGEIRGTEAYDFLEVINTGHPGSLSTIHADSPLLAFDRLALMVMRAGMTLSHSDIIGYAKRTIDIVIQVGRRNGKRGILQIYLPSLDR